MTIIPFAAFFVLIAVGLWGGELSVRTATVFVAVWVAGLWLSSLLGWSRMAFVAVEVVLDTILVFKLFGGDIRIR